MKNQFITMKKTGVTNPFRSGFVGFGNVSTDLGDYLRKINSYASLDAVEEKALALYKEQMLDFAIAHNKKRTQRKVNN